MGLTRSEGRRPAVLIGDLHVKAAGVPCQALHSLQVDRGSRWQHDHLISRQCCSSMLHGGDQPRRQQPCAEWTGQNLCLYRVRVV